MSIDDGAAAVEWLPVSGAAYPPTMVRQLKPGIGDLGP